jgi:hypothetical protein
MIQIRGDPPLRCRYEPHGIGNEKAGVGVVARAICSRWIVSVTFYGMTADREHISLDLHHPAYLNLSSANARAFLLFLGLEPGPEPSGEAPLSEARRGIMRARATFARRVRGYTRKSSDTMRPGQCRVIEGGLDVAYFARRIDDFERFVDAVAAKGATLIYWG